MNNTGVIITISIAQGLRAQIPGVLEDLGKEIVKMLQNDHQLMGSEIHVFVVDIAKVLFGSDMIIDIDASLPVYERLFEDVEKIVSNFGKRIPSSVAITSKVSVGVHS